MNMFSYVITHDSGFAPNPFQGFLTLATCKPLVRKTAKVGDVLVGTGSASTVGNTRLGSLVRLCHSKSMVRIHVSPPSVLSSRADGLTGTVTTYMSQRKMAGNSAGIHIMSLMMQSATLVVSMSLYARNSGTSVGMPLKYLLNSSES